MGTNIPWLLAWIATIVAALFGGGGLAKVLEVWWQHRREKLQIEKELVEELRQLFPHTFSFAGNGTISTGSPKAPHVKVSRRDTKDATIIELSFPRKSSMWIGTAVAIGGSPPQKKIAQPSSDKTPE
jgi:hypothetical protein